MKTEIKQFNNGCKPDIPDERDHIFEEIAGMPPLYMPTREQGYDVEEAIGKLVDDDQDGTYRCTTEGMTNDAEMTFLAHDINDKLHFSRKFVYPEIVLPGGGGSPRDVYKFWNKTGLCEEHLLPSFKLDGSLNEQWARTKGNITQEILDNAAKYKCDEYLSLNPTNIDSVRQAIFENNGCGGGFMGVNAGMGHFIFIKGWGIYNGNFGYKYKDSYPPYDKWIITKNNKWYLENPNGSQVELFSFWTAKKNFQKKSMPKLIRKKNTEKVYLETGRGRYWITNPEVFNDFRDNELIPDWNKIEEVDEFTSSVVGIIGDASITQMIKYYFGGIK